MGSIAEKLIESCRIYSSNIAVVQGDRVLRYDELDLLSSRLAYSLQERNVKKNSKVALMMLNEVDYIISFFALLKLEAIPIPVNLMYSAEDLGYVFTNAAIDSVIVNQGVFIKVNPLLLKFPQIKNIVITGDQGIDDVRAMGDFINNQTNEFIYNKSLDEETDLGILMYTSGTTGRPKGVMLSHKNIVSNVEGVLNVLRFISTDVVVLALPVFHTFGQICTLLTLTSGGKLVLIPKFTPINILEAVEKSRATILPLVPTMFTMLLEQQRTHNFNVQSLKWCVSGGASLPLKLLEEVESVFNVAMIEGYGLTETAPVIAINEENRIQGSIGKPIPGVDVRVVDENNNQVEMNKLGELVVKGPNIMLGYYKDEHQTRGSYTEDGWFMTGDLGTIDENGYIYISAERKKDLIIRCGENISPRAIEEVILKYPNIKEVAVVGIENLKRGEEIVAFVVGEGNVDEKQLRKFCQNHLQSYMLPKHIVQIDELPKGPTGKILKRILRDQALLAV